MTPSARSVKIVEWSEEDRYYVGSCPDLFHGCCHGPDERAVFAELCKLVNDTTELYQHEGRPLPPQTSGFDQTNTITSASSNS